MLIIRHLARFISQGKGPFQFLIKDIKEVKVCEHGLKQGVCIVRDSENAFTQKSHMFGLHRVNQSWWQEQEDGPQFPLGQETHPTHRAVIESQNCFGQQIKASSPIASWQTEGGKVEAVTDFVFLGSKITVDCDCSHEIQRHLLLLGKENYDKPKQCIKKQRHHFANKGPYGQSYGLSNSHVWVWELGS